MDFYVGGGGAVLTGHHVQQNTELEAGAGASFAAYRTPASQLRLGLDLVYFGYSKNMNGFTLGQGGYFSPQGYFAALLPVTWRERVDDRLTYELGGAVGVQTYRESGAPIFPIDPNLQSQLERTQSNPSTSIAGLNTSYPSRSSTGVSGNAHASVDYLVAPNVHLGANFTFQHAGDYSDAAGSIYARVVFDGTDH
jgi:hypothetical protein